MRLVTWNCNMALHEKWAELLALKPDVAIIPECADLDRLRALTPLFVPQEAVWIGDNPTKGLGVFGFNGYGLTLLPDFTPDLRHIAPVSVSGPTRFNLLAVWAFNNSGSVSRLGDQGPLLQALDRYGAYLTAGPAIVAGDFNNHVIWDKPRKANNHANAVSRLSEFGLVSAYHASRGVGQGEETEPTHYWRDRKKDGPTYHIDYVFYPEAWQAGVREVSIGTFEDWTGRKLSDHVPIVVDLDDSSISA